MGMLSSFLKKVGGRQSCVAVGWRHCVELYEAQHALGPAALPHLQGIDYDDTRIDKHLLTIQGEKICQSMAICRFVAREAGIGGRNSLEIAMVDEIVDVIQDAIEANVRAKK